MPVTLPTPEQALREYWGFNDFRAGQQAAVEACMAGRDGLVVMHTSGGKSLCYQVPAVCQPGVAVVISPLISLMKDQVDRLVSMGIPATFINSSLAPEDIARREHGVRHGTYKLLYCAPEKLDNPAFRDLLAQANISFVAVDEAHCVSTWGHDFRLAYRRLTGHLEDIARLRGRRVQRFAYTATATPEIRTDIMAELAMQDPFHTVGSFDRKNIAFHVKASESKYADTLQLLAAHAGEPIIIYSATIKAAEHMAERLASQGHSAGIYHGRMSGELKEQIQNDFQAGRIQTIVATNAFGMGVDKADVRNVIHLHMPANLESYYQEAGRGGRDGKPANAYLLYSKKDRGLQEFLIDMNYPEENKVRAVFNALLAYGQGEAFYLSENEIAGIARDHIESKYVPSILRILEDQHLIRLERDPNTHAYSGIEVIAEDDTRLDMTQLSERRRAVTSHLNTMEMFCMTRLCRRRYILRHFGENQDHDGCGYCDNCLNRGIGLSNGMHLPEKLVAHTLTAIQDMGGLYAGNMLVDALLGTQAQALRRRGLHERPFFGALSGWTSRDAQQLIDTLGQAGLVQRPRRHARQAGLSLTQSGQQWLRTERRNPITCPAVLRHRAQNTPAQGLSGRTHAGAVETAAPSDQALRHVLENLRRDLSRTLGKPGFMILSDIMLDRLCNHSPRSVLALRQAGLSEEKITLFGERILRTINDFHTPARKQHDAVPDIPI